MQRRYINKLYRPFLLFKAIRISAGEALVPAKDVIIQAAGTYTAVEPTPENLIAEIMQ